MIPFWGGDQEVSRWVAAKLNFGSFGMSRALGIVSEATDELVAGVVYHNFDPKAGIIELSAASDTPRWLTRKVLWAMFFYPFRGIGCQMVVLRVSDRNENEAGRGIKRVALAYGFKAIPIPRLYGRDEDGVLLTLTDDDWEANGFHREFRKE